MRHFFSMIELLFHNNLTRKKFLTMTTWQEIKDTWIDYSKPTKKRKADQDLNKEDLLSPQSATVLMGNNEPSAAEKLKSGKPKEATAYTFTSWECPKMLPYIHSEMAYLCYGKETAPNTGRLHWQGYVEVWKRGSGSAIVKRFSKHDPVWATCANVKIANHIERAEWYAKKDGDFHIFGVKVATQEGQRTDLDIMAANVVNGSLRVKQIMIQNPAMYHQYGRTLEKLEAAAMFYHLKEPEYPLVFDQFKIKINKPDPAVKCRHFWIIGRPDIGKTFLSQSMFAGLNVYTAWANDYPYEAWDGQDLILYDDYHPSFAEMSSVSNTFLIPTHVFGKTRFKPVYWKLGHTRTMIVLTNKEIGDVHFNNLEAMRARFTEIRL